MRSHLRVRKFLNKSGHHAGAFVIARVDDSSTCRDPDCSHEWCPGFILDIADCNRVVRLDFEVHTAAARRNSRHKIETLIDVLTRFRDALELEAGYAAARKQQR